MVALGFFVCLVGWFLFLFFIKSRVKLTYLYISLSQTVHLQRDQLPCIIRCYMASWGPVIKISKSEKGFKLTPCFSLLQSVENK